MCINTHTHYNRLPAKFFLWEFLPRQAIGLTMGIPRDPDPPVDTGDICNDCFGVAKEFGNIDTPDLVRATFTGVQPNLQNCIDDLKPPIPDIPETIILWLIQNDVAPCQFEYNYPVIPDLGWFALLDWHFSHILLGRRRIDLDCFGVARNYYDYLFYDITQPPCAVSFDENEYHQGYYQGNSGTAEVWWPSIP